MKFTFDPEKRRINLKRHGLDFADAPKVFSGHTLTDPDDRFDYGERRFITTGLLGVDVIIIAHTEAENEIRLVSMRKAQRHERESYFASIGG